MKSCRTFRTCCLNIIQEVLQVKNINLTWGEWGNLLLSRTSVSEEWNYNSSLSRNKALICVYEEQSGTLDQLIPFLWHKIVKIYCCFICFLLLKVLHWNSNLLSCGFKYSVFLNKCGDPWQKFWWKRNFAASIPNILELFKYPFQNLLVSWSIFLASQNS